MKGLVGSLSTPKGGFGNRVFSYVSLRHIAENLGVGYFSNNIGDRHLIPGIHRRRFLRASQSRRHTFRSSEILDDGFSQRAAQLVHNGQSLYLKGPLLGEVMVRYAKREPREFARLIANQCPAHTRAIGGRRLLTAHFRGGDFHQWNPDSILPSSYYLESLDQVGIFENEEWAVRLCFDDSRLASVQTVQKALQGNGALIQQISCANVFECDLAAMADSEILVASPSTFALTAGLLGDARLIHSKNWVSTKVEVGERFWAAVGTGSLPGLKLFGLI